MTARDPHTPGGMAADRPRRRGALAAAAAVLCCAPAARGYPPTLGKADIPADMPAEVRRLVEQLYDARDANSAAAARALGAMGPAAAPASPFLASMLDGHFSTESANQAAQALVKIGRDAFEAAAAAAASVTGGDARRRATVAIGRIDGERAVPVVLELLAARPSYRGYEWGVLRMGGRRGLARVLRALDSGEPAARLAAVRAMPAYCTMRINFRDITGHGFESRVAPEFCRTQLVVDRLLQAAGDADASVRLEALRSLAAVLPCPDRKLPLAGALLAARRDADAAVRLEAVGLVLAADETDKARFDALKPVLSDADTAVRVEATAALGSIAGERARAVPLLTDLLSDGAPAMREQAALLLGRLRATEAEAPLIRSLDDPARAVQAAAALAVGRCGGPDGVRAVMRRTKTGDTMVRFEAARALAERCLDLRGVRWDNGLSFRMTGNQGAWPARKGLLPVPAALRESFPRRQVGELMVELLRGPDAALHAVAAEALMEGLPGHDVSDDILLAALASSERMAHMVALLHIERFRLVPDKAFLQPLRHIARTGGDWPSTDGLALTALVRMGDAETVLPRCRRILQRGEPKTSGAALRLLREMGQPGLELLLKHLGDPRDGIRQLVVGALSKDMNDPQVAALVKSALAGPDEALRRGAAELTELVGREAAPDVPPTDDLRAILLSGPDAWKGRLRKLDARAVRAAADLLRDPDSAVRTAAADFLGQAGDSSAAAALAAALDDPSAPVRARAAEALGRLEARTCLSGLVAMLHDPAEPVRQSAAEALGRLGDANAAPTLVKALGGGDWHLRRAAAAALGSLRCAAAAAALAKALAGDPHWAVRGAAAAALGRIGDKSSAAALTAALNDEHWYVRRAARESLAAMVGPKPTGTPPGRRN